MPNTFTSTDFQSLKEIVQPVTNPVLGGVGVKGYRIVRNSQRWIAVRNVTREDVLDRNQENVATYFVLEDVQAQSSQTVWLESSFISLLMENNLPCHFRLVVTFMMMVFASKSVRPCRGITRSSTAGRKIRKASMLMEQLASKIVLNICWKTMGRVWDLVHQKRRYVLLD